MPSNNSRPISLKRILTLTIGARLLVDTGVRMLYPFLPVISRGLGISLVAAGSLMTIRTAVGLLAPWGGLAINRFGVKRAVLFGMAMQAVGAWWFSGAHGWLSSVGPMILLGVPLVIVVPAIQVLVSDLVPYAKRGRIMGAVEFSWAATNLFIIPLVGLLIKWMGWQAPFLYLAGVTAAGMGATWFWFPDHRLRHESGRENLWAYFSRLLKNRSALAVVLSGFFLFIGTESFFITYAAWLEQRFGLGPENIGMVVVILGLTELGGSGLSSAFIDRLGKRRGLLIGFSMASLV
ncbi:MAG: MFS transporter, partial [Gemmatimonadota bacterium]|nr:MFS transporter [Gemmatimonadota bacterium]